MHVLQADSHQERQGNGVGVWVAGTGKKALPATTGLLSTSAPRHTTIPDQREYPSNPHSCKHLPAYQPVSFVHPIALSK